MATVFKMKDVNIYVCWKDYYSNSITLKSDSVELVMPADSVWLQTYNKWSPLYAYGVYSGHRLLSINPAETQYKGVFHSVAKTSNIRFKNGVSVADCTGSWGGAWK